MTHIRDIMMLVDSLKKSQNALYELDHVLRNTKSYEKFPDHRDLLWDAIKTNAEILDRIDPKGEK